MPKYQVDGTTTISIYTIVEADSEEEAIETAMQRSFCSIGDPESYGDKSDRVWFHSGELDGDLNGRPTAEKVEEDN